MKSKVPLNETLPVSDKHHFVHLNQFVREEGHILKVLPSTHLSHSLKEESVFHFRQTDSRKQIGYDSLEQWNIMCEKFWEIDIKN